MKMTETRRLLCELSDNELMEKGIVLKDCLKRIAELELDKARINSHIKPIKSEIEDLIPIIDTRKEMRDVDCDWDFRWEQGVKHLYRTDNFEKIDTKTISDFERQQQLNMNNQEDN